MAVGFAGAVGCATVEPGYRTAQADRVVAPAQGMAARDQLVGVPNFYSARSEGSPASGAFAGGQNTAASAPVPPPPPATEPVDCNDNSAPENAP